MQGFMTYTAQEMRQYSRDYTSTFFSFVVPAAMYIFFGLMYGDAAYGDAGMSYFETYTPAMIGTIIFITAMFSIGVPYVSLREGGVFKRFLATPLTATAIVSSTLLRGVIMTTIGVLEMLIIGYFMFERQPTEYVFQFSLAFFLSTFSFFAFGFMITCFFKKVSAVLGFSFVLFYPMMFLSGATIPVESLPESMQAVSAFIPLTYVIDIMQLGWGGKLFTADAIPSALFLLAMMVVCTTVASKKFRWVD